MPKVVELFRHPVKSFTPELRDELKVVEGRVIGDRVMAFRFANSGPVDDWSWRTKDNYVVLVNTPELVRLQLNFDDSSRVLSLSYQDELFAEGSIDLEEDRLDLCEALGEFVSSLDVNPLVGHPERVPLKLLGDGREGVFHDNAAGSLTLYSAESLKALESHMGTEIDGRRFRANVVIDGIDAWEELAWSGRVSIGDGEFKVVKAVTRCLATHANPESGARDLDILGGLVHANGTEAPTFAVRLEPLRQKDEITIRVGDPIMVGTV